MNRDSDICAIESRRHHFLNFSWWCFEIIIIIIEIVVACGWICGRQLAIHPRHTHPFPNSNHPSSCLATHLSLTSKARSLKHRKREQDSLYVHRLLAPARTDLTKRNLVFILPPPGAAQHDI
ncbi:hypothetical protein AA313_de0209776 [Arthrobotrys entomopaga]|nr:hypothetical protein AA313_de0209776 [Arthrobotrys entomopaga]